MELTDKYDNESLEILQKVEDMMAYASPLMDKWSVRDMHKIGNRLNSCMCDLIELAVSIRWKRTKKTTLSDFDMKNKAIQSFVKVAYELKVLKGHSSYKEWTRRSKEIGSMVGEYIKKVYEEEMKQKAETEKTARSVRRTYPSSTGRNGYKNL